MRQWHRCVLPTGALAPYLHLASLLGYGLFSHQKLFLKQNLEWIYLPSFLLNAKSKGIIIETSHKIWTSLTIAIYSRKQLGMVLTWESKTVPASLLSLDYIFDGFRSVVLALSAHCIREPVSDYPMVGCITTNLLSPISFWLWVHSKAQPIHRWIL